MYKILTVETFGSELGDVGNGIHKSVIDADFYIYKQLGANGFAKTKFKITWEDGETFVMNCDCCVRDGLHSEFLQENMQAEKMSYITGTYRSNILISIFGEERYKKMQQQFNDFIANREW